MAASINDTQRTASLDKPRESQESDAASTDSEKQVGVKAAEASYQVSGSLIWFAWIGLALTAYVTGLDNNTTYAYQTAASMQFQSYPLYLSVISVTQQVIIAVGKFPIAKLADVFGRAEGYMISVTLYVIGFIILAACQNFAGLVAGTVFYAFGNTGTQIMQQIVVADYFSSKLRGLAIGLLSLPYIINFACAPLIVGQLAPVGVMSNLWRWGPGSFSIIIPVATAPIILSLALSQRRARKVSLAPRHEYLSMGPLQGLKAFMNDIDVGCLILISAGFILILLPLGIHANTPQGWAAPHIIVMFVIGGICIIAIGFWEWLIAVKPILKLNYFLNKDIFLPAFGIGFFDFLAFYIAWSPSYSWAIVTRAGFTSQDATYFANTQSLCLTVFGIAAGALSWYLKRYKWILFSGCCIRLLGIGLMIRYREASSSTVQIVFPQIIQGLGGGLMGVTLQVAAQVSVRHQYVAMVTAFVLLMTEIGGACGTAILGSLQSTYLLPEMQKRLLPLGVSQADIEAAYLSPFSATWAFGTPERDAFIGAWNYYIRVGLIIAAVISAVPIISTLFLTDHKLGNGQNAVSDEMAGSNLGATHKPEDVL
jgi:MFS family permease